MQTILVVINHGRECLVFSIFVLWRIGTIDLVKIVHVMLHCRC